jgi:putative serine protease PepD
MTLTDNQDPPVKNSSQCPILKILLLIGLLLLVVLSDRYFYYKGTEQALTRPLVISAPKNTLYLAQDIYKAEAASVVEITAPDGSVGSGFYITPNIILTNNHVVSTPFDSTFPQVSVTLANGTSTVGTVFAEDPLLDLALIQTSIQEHPLTFANSNKVAYGAPVVTLGAAMGLSPSLAQGVVSNPFQEAPTYRETPVQGFFIQVDMNVNPGNSGGPLLNAQGQVEGIVTIRPNAIGTKNVYGVALAIPSTFILHALPALEAGQKPTYASLGVSGTPNLSPAGLLLNKVPPNNLPQGSILLDVGPYSVSSTPTLQVALLHYLPGQSVTLRYFYQGKITTKVITTQTLS